MQNKRGQELSTNVIILIILGIIVLVILVLGFTIGWDKILPFLNQNNIETIKTSCSTACATANIYDFCSVLREVKDGVNDKFSDTCYNLVTKSTYASRGYGISTCSSITCPSA